MVLTHFCNGIQAKAQTLCSRQIFQGCLYSKQSWEIEMIFLCEGQGMQMSGGGFQNSISSSQLATGTSKMRQEIYWK